ncbi:hypothetical protein [Methylomarinum vadi]|nr:hypothetical protein [Methylomarinum vadi]
MNLADFQENFKIAPEASRIIRFLDEAGESSGLVNLSGLNPRDY